MLDVTSEKYRKFAKNHFNKTYHDFPRTLCSRIKPHQININFTRVRSTVSKEANAHNSFLTPTNQFIRHNWQVCTKACRVMKQQAKY